MSGYAYGESEPRRDCPYCDTECHADFVDVGVGMIQCGPYHCQACGASEIGGYDKERELTDDEKRTGWYAPGSEPSSSANVIGGKIVSATKMNEVYRKEFINNPLHGEPGYVESWREGLRKDGLK